MLDHVFDFYVRGKLYKYFNQKKLYKYVLISLFVQFLHKLTFVSLQNFWVRIDKYNIYGQRNKVVNLEMAYLGHNPQCL